MRTRTRIRSIWALTATVSLTLLSTHLATSAASASPTAAAQPGHRGPGPSYQVVGHGGGAPAKSTVGPRADFNGDGFGDLAVGVPGEDIGTHANAGGVNVLYGTSSGLKATGNQFWSQDSSGVIGNAETNDAFGQALAVGDFNHDGYSDLAVGVPFESIGSITNAGGVNILYGSAAGLTGIGSQFFSQDTAGIRDKAEAGDEFGFALAARDFNGDGYTDLAVGVPRENTKGAVDEGAVNVIYGSSKGLTGKGDQFVPGYDAGDEFGYALAAGNIDGKNAQDLAVGAPGTKNDQVADSGMVLFMPGTSSGMGFPRTSLNFTEVAGEECGTSLTVGNFDNDGGGLADVAVGCPHASYTWHDQGGVEIHPGADDGLGVPFAPLVSPIAQAGDEFGSSLASGDVGRDSGGGGDDLVIGTPLMDINGDLPDVGDAWIVYFTSGGPTFQELRQGLNGTIGSPESGDIFGAAVATGNFDGDSWADVAIGVPGERLGNAGGAGGVNVLYGSAGGITSSGNQFWSQASAGILGVAEPEDFFGDAVSARAG